MNSDSSDSENEIILCFNDNKIYSHGHMDSTQTTASAFRLYKLVPLNSPLKEKSTVLTIQLPRKLDEKIEVNKRMKINHISQFNEPYKVFPVEKRTNKPTVPKLISNCQHFDNINSENNVSSISTDECPEIGNSKISDFSTLITANNIMNSLTPDINNIDSQINIATTNIFEANQSHNNTRISNLDGSKCFKWSDVYLQDEALKYKSKKEFLRKNPLAYRTASHLSILDKICQHMHKRNRPNVKWTYESLVEEALKYKTRSDFKKGSSGAYQTAMSLRILNKICQHTEAKPRTLWTQEILYSEALKYKTQKEFQKGNTGAYNACLKYGILDTICQHMQTKPRFLWTDEKLQEEALNYTSRSDFKKQSTQAYEAAWVRDILDTVCSHMTTPI